MWHFLKDGETQGPVTSEQLLGLVRNGAINQETLVWTAGQSEWLSIQQTALAAQIGPADRRGRKMGPTVNTAWNAVKAIAQTIARMLVAELPLVRKRVLHVLTAASANPHSTRVTFKFTMFEHPAGGLEGVKNGWSWPGFFFSGIWAVSKRLYGLAVIPLILLVADVVVTIEWVSAKTATHFSVNHTSEDRDLQDQISNIRTFDDKLRAMRAADDAVMEAEAELAEIEREAKHQKSLLIAMCCSIFATLASGLIFGAKGNTWRRFHLQLRGYQCCGEQIASTQDGAIAEHLRGNARH